MSEKAAWNESALCPRCETSGAMQWHEEEAGVRMLCSECPCVWYWQTPDDFHDPMSPTENIVTT